MCDVHTREVQRNDSGHYMCQINTEPMVSQIGVLEVRTCYSLFKSFNFKNTYCTNEILISDVNSDKNSLAIIYMCLKMYCLKYVVNLIYFYSCGPGVAI